MKVVKAADFRKHEKIYGATTVGARGQIVIPVEARADLDIKPGDHLIVMGKYNKALGLIKDDQLSELFEAIMEHVPDKVVEKKEIERYFKDIVGHFTDKG